MFSILFVFCTFTPSLVFGTPILDHLPTRRELQLSNASTLDSFQLTGSASAFEDAIGVDLNTSWLDEDGASDFASSKTKRSVRGNGIVSTVFQAPSLAGTGGTDTYNFTWHKCATIWDQPIGTWTFWNGTTANITWIDMYRDNCDHAGLDYNHGRQQNNSAYLTSLNAATQTNVNLMIEESMTYIKNLQCTAVQDPLGGGFDANYHNELRKLLQLDDNYWTFVFVGLGMQMGISYSLYNYGHPNNTVFQNALPGINAAITGLGAAILGYLATKPKLQATDQQLVAGTAATVRTSSNYMSRFWKFLSSTTSSAASTALSAGTSGSVGGSSGSEPIGGGEFMGSSNGGISEPVGGGVFVDPEANGRRGRRTLEERQITVAADQTCIPVEAFQLSLGSIGAESFPPIGWVPFQTVEADIDQASSVQCLG